MPAKKSPRKGSLQFWPRKRAKKFLPRVNWNSIDSQKSIKGFIGYKVGMLSITVKDNTPNSLTNGKNIVIPVTAIECPPMKILSVRFYKDGKVMTEIVSKSLEKDLKRKIKFPKTEGKKIEDIKDYDNVSLIVYSQVKKTGIKKSPDLIEVGLSGSVEEKLNFAKENLGKEISLPNVFEKGDLVDVRGLTKGQGLSGPVKRFGITLKSHKSEKGRRRPGSLGPWHPARVTFRVPQAGQLGMFTRNIYNNKIVFLGNSSDRPLKGMKNFGNVNTDYVLVRGSVQGPAKRQLILSHGLRPTKKQLKKDFELI
ncbi:MAG: 50S ribosomal protein L3 [Candidatus Pacearchaeota archaeon]